MANDNKDQELLGIFIEEATDLLTSVSSTLRAWEVDLTNLNKISDLKRDLHTLKGSARMVGLTTIGTLTHELETLCEALAKGQIKVDRALFDRVCLEQDQIATMIEQLRSQKSPLLQNEEKTEELKAATQTQEVIRVRADLLEKLNSLSTENSMMRVGLEQQVATLGHSLLEMKQGSKRLENQLDTLSYELEGDTAEALDQIHHSIRETNLDLLNILKNLVDTHSMMESLVLNQARVSTELQHRLTSTRLVHFESIIPRLSKIVRQISTELQKQVDFKVVKSEGEMDRAVLEHLIPSLEHILRNAIDHGIESLEERRKKGKPDVGRIEVSFVRAGSNISIEIKDDGGGIDYNVIRAKAIKLGLLSSEEMVSDQEVIRFILQPGFSTREAVTEISGRGVGMDVVNVAIKEMGGNLNINSKLGVGTQMILRFPFTVSLNRIMLFKVQEQTYGMLLANVEAVVNLSVDEIREPLYEQAEKSYHLHYLGFLLNPERKQIHIPRKKTFPVILFSDAEYSIALIVDTILYNRDLMVQALGAQFKLTNDYVGATVLGDGQVVFILDPYMLSADAKILSERGKLDHESQEEKSLEFSKPILVMVVDDSISVRTVTKRLLERYQYRVMTAKDGIEALSLLEVEIPDIILLDIDMPRMDGFEFALSIRADEKYKNIPIVIITSRSREHRKRAQEMNLNHMLEKPYQETELLSVIDMLLGNSE